MVPDLQQPKILGITIFMRDGGPSHTVTCVKDCLCNILQLCRSSGTRFPVS